MMKLLEKIRVGGATDLCLVAGWANKGKYKGISGSASRACKGGLMAPKTLFLINDMPDNRVFQKKMVECQAHQHKSTVLIKN
jgi:hypothetical protein